MDLRNDSKSEKAGKMMDSWGTTLNYQSSARPRVEKYEHANRRSQLELLKLGLYLDTHKSYTP